MEDWQERVRGEYNQLDKRTTDLTLFMEGDTYSGLPHTDKIQLAKQQMAMLEYLDTLHVRIQNFKGS